MVDYRRTYAQNREDIILAGFFEGQKNGFYVDVGANHPDHLSVTKLFYEQGWRGINIEPNSKLFANINKQRTRDINLKVGIADKPGELVLREYPDGDGLSTFSEDTQRSYQDGSSEYKSFTKNYVDTTVPVTTLKNIFETQQIPAVDFIKIDVEGFEYEVIAGNDWQKYRPKVICVEANHVVRDWRPLLKKADYEEVFFDGLNEYYVAGECVEIKKNFSYVKAVLLKPVAVDAEFYNRLERANWQLAQEQQKFSRQETVIEKLNADIAELHTQISTNKRVRTLIRQLGRSLDAIVLMHIEKLNVPNKFNAARLPKLSAADSAQQLLSKISEYDFQRYYEAKPSRSYRYRALRSSYIGVTRAGAKSVLKLYRKVKRHA